MGFGGTTHSEKALLPLHRAYVAGSVAALLAVVMVIGLDVGATQHGVTAVSSGHLAGFLVLATVALATLAAIVVFAYQKTGRRDEGDAASGADASRLADAAQGLRAPFAIGDRDLEPELRLAQFTHIYNQLSLMMLASAANAVLVAFALWGSVNSTRLAIWLVVALAAFGIGLMARARIAPRMPLASVSKRTLRRTTLHAGLRGLIWGVCFAIFFVEADTPGRLVLVSVAAGMLTAGVPALAPVPSAALLYGLGVIVPVILRLLSMSGYDYQIVALFGLTFSGSMVVVACQLYGNFAGHLISRRLEAEQSATISLLLREFETNASDWLFETDGQGCLVRFPERMAKLLGLTNADGAPALALALAGAADTGRRALLDAMATGEPFQGIEIGVCHADGREFWMALSASPKPGGGYRGVGSDITELKLRAAEIAEKSRRLAASNEALQQFATVASHDLQEPLRKIEAFGQRLQSRNAGKLDEESTMYVDRMLAATKRMRALITDLLSYSRVSRANEASKIVDLDQLLAGVLDDLAVVIEDKKARITSAPLGTIPGKATLLRQLLQNLISNAMKFTKPGEAPQISIERIARDAGGIELRIRDNGIGFDMADKAKIFEIFQRLHSREQYEGTGVGLATCRRIAETHGGSIDATSAPGEGATFIVTLPTTAAATASQPAPANAPRAA